MDPHSQTQWLPPVSPTAAHSAPVPEAPAAVPAPGPARPAQPPSALRRALGPLFLVGVLALKYGKAALLLLPKAKLLTTGASMLVSVAAYALLWGWRFAAGFVALLFVHEMGHAIQMKREGVNPSWMVFIPFLGAAVGARSLGGNALAEARIGLAGPILGTLGALALIPVAAATDSDLLRALAFTGLFLNLFNLVPVTPFDGGRAMAALAPWMWFVGLGGLAVLVFVATNPFLILFLLIGAFDVYRRWKHRKEGLEGNKEYYRVKPAHRLVVLGVYLALIAACAIGMDATFVERSLDEARS